MSTQSLTSTRPSTLNVKASRSVFDEPDGGMQRQSLDLSNPDCAAGTSTRIEFLVEEGPWLYRLDDKRTGWGSALAGVNCARVMILRVTGDSPEAELLAEAEVRTNPSRPWRNAGVIAGAAAVLVEQGFLSRASPRRIKLRPLNPPSTGISGMWRWARRSFLPTLRQSIAWSVGNPKRAQWTIGMLPKAAVEHTGQFPWDKVAWLEPPEDGIIADPFLVEESGTHWLFYEHMLFDEPNGTLWAGRLNTITGLLSDKQEVLRTQNHLSFPNVFKVNGTWYMLPEESQSGATKLYQATNFPSGWRECRLLLPDFPGGDPVLHQHDGKWWLFVTHDVSPCVDNNLHLFWSDSLDGVFHPHPLNPIRSGLRGSRMAGPIFKHGRKLIRPAQDGREGYGHGVILQEVLSLTPTNYVEKELCAWNPDRQGRFADGFHAFQTCGHLLVIDALRLIRPKTKSRRHCLLLIPGPEILDSSVAGYLPTLVGL